ncbi:MAG: type II toxin-antitoxin system RelE/ParE family toxin [Rhodanobacteraceae bacterium]
MRVVFAEPAARDLDGIVETITLVNPTAAERVFRAIVNTTHRLVDFPEMGRAGRLPGTREITVAGLPYLVVCQVAGDVITVVAVFHEARDLVRALAERQGTRG